MFFFSKSHVNVRVTRLSKSWPELHQKVAQPENGTGDAPWSDKEKKKNGSGLRGAGSQATPGVASRRVSRPRPINTFPFRVCEYVARHAALCDIYCCTYIIHIGVFEKTNHYTYLYLCRYSPISFRDLLGSSWPSIIPSRYIPYTVSGLILNLPP